MKQRVHLITLGVENVDKSADFYRALGWQEVTTQEGITVFDLYGASLGLYNRNALSKDIGKPLPKGSGALTLSCNVREKEEVETVLKEAKKAGGIILKQAHDVFWGGHIGYFEDLDGHIWEVAHNPFSPLGRNDEFYWSGY